MHVDDDGDDDDDDDDDGGNPTRKPCIIIITSFLAGDLEPKVALAGSRAVMNLPPVTVSRPEKISPHPCPLVRYYYYYYYYYYYMHVDYRYVVCLPIDNG